MGLSSEQVSRLEEQAESQNRALYISRLQQDVHMAISERDAYMACVNSYNEDCSCHDAKRTENARRAMEKFLFNKAPQDEGSGKGGFVKIEHLPLDKFGELLVHKVKDHLRDVLRSPAALRKHVTEKDVGVWLILDFPAMGTLKEELMRQCRTAVTNLFGAGLDAFASGFYPEVPKGC